uniref:Uncharacterized protein n=1 Tax=Arundo donax TaxID=35708 RepID=A0A0A9F669_ARUDO
MISFTCYKSFPVVSVYTLPDVI